MADGWFERAVSQGRRGGGSALANIFENYGTVNSPTYQSMPESWNPGLRNLYAHVGDAGLGALSGLTGLLAGGAGAIADIGDAVGLTEGSADRLGNDLAAMATEMPWAEYAVPATAAARVASPRQVATGVRMGADDFIRSEDGMSFPGEGRQSNPPVVPRADDTRTPLPEQPPLPRDPDALPPQLAHRAPVGRPVGGGASVPAFDAGPSGPNSPNVVLSRDGQPVFTQPTNMDDFNASQTAARDSRGGIGLSVDVYPPDQLEGATTFETPGGGASFVVQPDGELASVVSHAETGPRGIGKDILQASSEQGAKHLQAFEGLTPTYGQGGYRPVARLPFNRGMMVEDHGEDLVSAFEQAQPGRADPDLVFMARDPSFTGRVDPTSGGTRFDDWDDAQAAVDAEVKRMEGRRTPLEATYVAPDATGRVDGSLGLPETMEKAVTWKGADPSEWSPQDWHDFGAAHGVDNLGPPDQAAWETGLRRYQTPQGEISIPAGDGPFTYYDLLHMKAQGIDPRNLPPELGMEIHRRTVAGIAKNELTDENVFNGMVMGALSPNNPLTPNELAAQRAMIKGPQDLQRLGALAGYDYKTDAIPDLKARQAQSREIVDELGVGAAERDGLGAAGSANYTDLAETAQKFRDRPDFYRFDTRNYGPDLSESEKWSQFVTEVMNESRGQGVKTTSFSTVWQDPENAAISAIDRHMAGLFKDEMFPDEKARQAFHKQTIKKYNEKYPDRPNIKTWDEFDGAPGAKSVFVDQAMALLGRKPGAKFRDSKGEVNTRIPEYLRNADFVTEPSKVEMIGDPMNRALEANQKRARDEGLGLFSSQWKNWDPLRMRYEPHEIMFRGLERLPRMSLEQMRGVNDAHTAAGYRTSPATVRRVSNPSSLGYFAVPAGAVGLSQTMGDEYEREAVGPQPIPRRQPGT